MGDRVGAAPAPTERRTTVKLLHTELSPRFLEPLEARLATLTPAVGLAPLGAERSPALLIGYGMSAAELETARAAGVQWIQAMTAGLEKVLVPEIVASDVVVTSSGGGSARPMAEFVMARILEHAKKLPVIAAQQREQRWKAVWSADVAGSTLTMVGLGPIGQRIAQLGKAFDMRVIGVRRRVDAGAGPCDEVVGPDGLRDAMARADYVVLAPPLTPLTRGLIGEAELAAMKDGALLVNVGRGDLVDEAALLAATAGGRIVAALDVAGTEPLPADSPLWQQDAIRISPHCSAITPSLYDTLIDFVAGNVQRFLDGRPLESVVDKESGYPVADVT
jgi:phosphoglycerate dehydrogenase-like enzyme